MRQEDWDRMFKDKKDFITQGLENARAKRRAGGSMPTQVAPWEVKSLPEIERYKDRKFKIGEIIRSPHFGAFLEFMKKLGHENIIFKLADPDPDHSHRLTASEDRILKQEKNNFVELVKKAEFVRVNLAQEMGNIIKSSPDVEKLAEESSVKDLVEAFQENLVTMAVKDPQRFGELYNRIFLLRQMQLESEEGQHEIKKNLSEVNDNIRRTTSAGNAVSRLASKSLKSLLRFGSQITEADVFKVEEDFRKNKEELEADLGRSLSSAEVQEAEQKAWRDMILTKMGYGEDYKRYDKPGRIGKGIQRVIFNDNWLGVRDDILEAIEGAHTFSKMKELGEQLDAAYVGVGEMVMDIATRTPAGTEDFSVEHSLRDREAGINRKSFDRGSETFSNIQNQKKREYMDHEHEEALSEYEQIQEAEFIRKTDSHIAIAKSMAEGEARNVQMKDGKYSEAYVEAVKKIYLAPPRAYLEMQEERLAEMQAEERRFSKREVASWTAAYRQERERALRNQEAAVKAARIDLVTQEEQFWDAPRKELDNQTPRSFQEALRAAKEFDAAHASREQRVLKMLGEDGEYSVKFMEELQNVYRLKFELAVKHAEEKVEVMKKFGTSSAKYTQAVTALNNAKAALQKADKEFWTKPNDFLGGRQPQLALREQYAGDAPRIALKIKDAQKILRQTIEKHGQRSEEFLEALKILKTVPFQARLDFEKERAEKFVHDSDDKQAARAIAQKNIAEAERTLDAQKASFEDTEFPELNNLTPRAWRETIASEEKLEGRLQSQEKVIEDMLKNSGDQSEEFLKELQKLHEIPYRLDLEEAQRDFEGVKKFSKTSEPYMDASRKLQEAKRALENAESEFWVIPNRFLRVKFGTKTEIETPKDRLWAIRNTQSLKEAAQKMERERTEKEQKEKEHRPSFKEAENELADLVRRGVVTVPDIKNKPAPQEAIDPNEPISPEQERERQLRDTEATIEEVLKEKYKNVERYKDKSSKEIAKEVIEEEKRKFYAEKGVTGNISDEVRADYDAQFAEYFGSSEELWGKEVVEQIKKPGKKSRHSRWLSTMFSLAARAIEDILSKTK